MGDRSGAYIVLVGKPEGRKSLGRLMPRWEGNTRNFSKWDGEAWARLIWPKIGDRWGTVVSAVTNLLVPENAGNLLTG